MNVYLLLDVGDDDVEYVVTSETTEARQIQDIINKVKEEKAGYWCFDDICEAMPDDVEIIDCEYLYY